MPFDDLFRLTFGPLRPGEERIREARETDRAITDAEAEILCDAIRARAARENIRIEVGPRVIRERNSTNGGPVRHITTAVAIIRKPTPTEEHIRKLVVEQIAIEHRSLEEMVERMLTDPESRGIMVVLDQEQQTRSYRLDADIPFGHIFEFPSLAAVDEWRARGCPG
jgi:hypothetical protein